MRIELKADNFIEWLGDITLQAPVPLADVFIAVIRARAIMAALKFKLFEFIEQGHHTLAALAAKTNIDQAILTHLLNILISSDYLKRANDQYRLKPMTKKFLLSRSKHNIINMMLFNYIQWDLIGRMEDSISSGKGVDFHNLLSAPAEWQSYQHGMLDLAKPIAKIVAKKIPVSAQAKKLLDVGGSHGLYGHTISHYGKRALECTVLELSHVLEHAKKLAEQEGIANDINYKAGSIVDYNITEKYDVIFLGNILHHFDEVTNRKILQKLFAALNDSGSIAILEFAKPSQAAKSELVTDCLALFYFITSTSACFTIQDYKSWLLGAGFNNVKVKKIICSPTSRLIIATK